MGRLLATEDQTAAVRPEDRYLSEQLDKLRDAAKKADPNLNLHLFVSFLESLPDTAGAIIRFRAKANIGLQHLARGDGPTAVRWLIEACDEAPDDPRAVANRALALWIGGDAEGAYRYGRERLVADPTNKDLASYLPQIAVLVPSVVDGLEGISDALRETEPVQVAQAVFLRGRDVRPDWWDWARAAASRFPESDHLKVIAAFSHVDEVTRDDAIQRTRILVGEKRERLKAAAEILDADWQSKPWLLHNTFDDAPHTLAGAMIAYQLLHDAERALSLATKVADERIDAPDILQNATMVALSHGREELAERLIALAPDNPDLKFQSAIIAVQKGDWAEAAALFAEANVPDNERRVAETVAALAPLKAAGRPQDGSEVDRSPLRALLAATLDSPRGLVLIAQVAQSLDATDVAEDAFTAAVDAVPEDCHIATRLMVAAYAFRAGSASTVVQLLDGHLPFAGFEREQEQLALAHANERPHRPRNLAYFRRLPLAVRERHEIARAHATVLLDAGQLPEALALLKKLHAENATDAYVSLRLLDALHRTGDESGFDRIAKTIDLAGSVGAPEYVMSLAQLVMRAGEPERAYPVGYDLVRRHADDAQVAMGYLSIGLLSDAPNPSFRMDVAGLDACVTITGPGAASQTFVIDAGSDFFGIAVQAPGSGMAVRVAGKRAGDTFELTKMGADPETWTVSEVKSKYLHLHHRIMEEFEFRFPGQPGIARFTVGEGNIDAVLDIVRRSAEQNVRNAAIYAEQQVPLAIVARLLGGDAVSFAQFVRRLGGSIATCAGSGEERNQATATARRYRGKGAALDPYTAWVAYHVGALPAMKDWFGKLLVPGSAIRMIDRMIAREKEGFGRKQMTISWYAGEFYRDEVTDDFRQQQIDALNRVRDGLFEHCEVRQILVPDEISDAAATILEMSGSSFLDAAFLAKEEGAVLLSDDMRYRQWAAFSVGTEGIWLQASLLAALEGRKLAPPDYAKAVMGLAGHAHDHICLSGPLLLIIAREDVDELHGLRAALRFLAGPKAEMTSHLSAFGDFVNRLWNGELGLSPLRVRAATGLALEALIEKRPRDWQAVLALGLSRLERDRELTAYLATWMIGHFIDVSNILPSRPSGERSSKRVERRNRGKARGQRRT